LPAQRDKNPADGGEIQTAPEAHEQLIHRCLMKVDQPIPPALQPELIVPPDTQARSSAFTNFSDSRSSVNWGSLGGYSSSSLIGYRIRCSARAFRELSDRLLISHPVRRLPGLWWKTL